MTAQVIINGTPATYESGATIPVEAGDVVQIATIDANGNVGPVVDPTDLDYQLNTPAAGDLQVTLDDGTVLILRGMVALLGDGDTNDGLANADGLVTVASIEDVIPAPAAGGQTATAADGGGSSDAFNQFDPNNPGGPSNFGGGARSGFTGGGGDGIGGATDAVDPNLILLAGGLGPGGGPGAAGGGPPVLALIDDAILTNHNEPMTLPAASFLTNDTVTGGLITGVTGANVALDVANQLITITSFDGLVNANSGATDSFTYTVTDGAGQTATATVDLTFDRFPLRGGPVDGTTGSGPGNDLSEIFVADHNSGNNTLEGGLGDDIFHVDSGFSISIDGGPGNDTVVPFDFAGAAETEVILGLISGFGPGNSVEVIDGSQHVARDPANNSVIIQDPNAGINAWTADFSLTELIAIDAINGLGGNDSIIGSAGNDTIQGGDGSDTLDGGAGDDRLNGNAGNDSLLGGAGNDSIFGGNGTDSVDGGPGDDFIDIGANTTNNERVIISDRADGIDTIANFDNIGGLHDVLDLDALFDDLAADLGVALDTAARTARLSLVQDGADTNVFIDQSAAGDGSDLVQIADVLDSTAAGFQIGGAATDDIFVGA